MINISKVEHDKHPKILSSSSSRGSARCSCWAHAHEGCPTSCVKVVWRCLCSCGFPDSGIFNADPVLLRLPLGIRFSIFPLILSVVVTCDLLYLLIYGARLLLIPGESALSLSQRQPITPSAFHSCHPEESAPQANPETSDPFSLALQLVQALGFCNINPMVLQDVKSAIR